MTMLISLVCWHCIWRSQERIISGTIISVNWDITEMEAHKEEIEEKKLLKSSWLPVLPFGGGKGPGLRKAQQTALKCAEH
jgi:hypothetical protein